MDSFRIRAPTSSAPEPRESNVPERQGGLFPREHGAWSMLIQPFVWACVLEWRWSWFLIPAAAAMVAVFLARQPLVVLGRQKFVWKNERPESAEARRWLIALAAVLIPCAAVLWMRWPVNEYLAFGGGAAAMTAFAAWMTVKNRQRSVPLQLISAAGLSSSAAVACLSIGSRMPGWCWWLWTVSAMHAAAGVLVVHARLDARVAARKPGATYDGKPAMAMQGVLLCLVPFAAMRAWPLGVALALAAAVNLWNLRSLSNPEALAVPLMTVGLRAMALSIAVSLLTVWGLSR